MVRNIARATSAMALACVLFSAGSLAAQEAVLAEFYGSGVHHYFAGNTSQAIGDLTAAINGGSKDPRAFYFRALAELKTGQQVAATTDLQLGAALETADVNQFYPVAKSLERVQGPARLSLERYRALARAEAYERHQRRESIRYEQRRRAEAEVLRNPKFAPLGQGAAPLPPPAGAPPPPAEDPFAEDADKKPPVPKPPAAEPPDEMPAEEPAAEAPAAPNKEAAPKADEDNPFGDEKGEEK